LPIDKARVQAICFDIDGTLRDTDDQYAASLAHGLERVRWLISGGDAEKLARQMVMMSETPANYFFAVLDAVGLDGPLSKLGNLFHSGWADITPKEYKIIPDVPQAVAWLAQRYPLTVISTRGRRETIDFLEFSGLLSHFQEVVTAQTVKRLKPHPAPIHWAARQMGVSADQCLMVGDTTVDIIAGRRAGAQTVGVLSGFGDEGELSRAGADAILESVADLPAFLTE
jgi:phosphoglycolate phosphatase-like HAD superfamily hydrolase